MNEKKKNHILLTIIIAVIANFGVIFIDYLNVLSKIGFDISNLNFEICTIVIGNTVVVVLFIITYFLVDTRNIQKDKNRLMVTYITLMGIYERCNDMVEIFSQDDLRERAAKRCDGKKYINEDEAHSHFLNYPFENEAIIYDFAKSGILSKEVFEEFVKIKQHYQKYINTAIIFYDNYNRFKELEVNLSQNLAKIINELREYVEENSKNITK